MSHKNFECWVTETYFSSRKLYFQPPSMAEKPPLPPQRKWPAVCSLSSCSRGVGSRTTMKIITRYSKGKGREGETHRNKQQMETSTLFLLLLFLRERRTNVATNSSTFLVPTNALQLKTQEGGSNVLENPPELEFRRGKSFIPYVFLREKWQMRKEEASSSIFPRRR